MGVGAFVKKIFETQVSTAEAVIQAAFIKSLEDRDKTERDAAQRLLDWYGRDREKILEHLELAASKAFDSTSDWSWPIVNGVPRTIRRLSMAYRQPPIREYYKGTKYLKPSSDGYKKIEKMYSRLNLDRKMRTADRYSTLLNTVHYEVVMRNDFIDWDLRLRPSVTIVPDPEDYLEFAKFAYSWEPLDPETLVPTKGWVYWSEDRHVFLSAGGVEVGMTEDDGSNPYRDSSGAPVIPIVTIRKIEDISDYWGHYGADLVDAFEQKNIELANLWETMRYQVEGWPLLINCDVQAGAKILFGAKHPLVAKKVTKDDVIPDVKFPKPDPNIEEARDTLDWFIKMNASAYGMPPSSWALDEERLSGFAKYLDNTELFEAREEELPQWEDIENDLFKKSVIVWNYHCQDGDEIDEDIEQRTSFPPARILESPTEKSTRWALEISSGLKSPVDYYMEEEGLDEDEALDRALEVAKMNKKISKAAAPPTPPMPAFPGTNENTNSSAEEEENPGSVEPDTSA